MNWTKVFASTEAMQNQLAEGKPRLLIIGDLRLCAVMRHQQLHVMQDACPHNGESLSKGSLNYLGEIICPWHGYRFEMKTGRESSERCKDLETYPVRITDEGVFVGL